MREREKDARENYLQNHIKGARFIDLDKDLAEIGEDAAFGGRHPCQKFQNLQKLYKNLGISEILTLWFMTLLTVQMQLLVVGGC